MPVIFVCYDFITYLFQPLFRDGRICLHAHQEALDVFFNFKNLDQKVVIPGINFAWIPGVVGGNELVRRAEALDLQVIQVSDGENIS